MPDAPFSEREPVALGVGSIAALVDALVVLCAAYDWLPIDAGQATAIVVFITALCGVVGTLMREHVWSPATVAALTGPRPVEEP